MIPSLSVLNALALALGATLAFVLLVRVGERLATFWAPLAERPSSREAASRRILGQAIGQALAVILVATLLLRAGLSLGDLGLTRPVGAPVWGAALALAALAAAGLVGGPLRRSAALRDWSAYRVSGGLLAGFGAGFGEEVVFRGFLMNVLGWSGVGALPQVVVSGALFGLARAGWASGLVRPSAWLGLGAAVVGWLLALLYLWGGRSLLPVMVAHGLVEAVVQPALLEVVVAWRWGSESEG